MYHFTGAPCIIESIFTLLPFLKNDYNKKNSLGSRVNKLIMTNTIW